MKLQDLLKVVSRAQCVRILNSLWTVYTGELDDWEDRDAFGAWFVSSVYVGLFGTLTINIERGIK